MRWAAPSSVTSAEITATPSLSCTAASAAWSRATTVTLAPWFTRVSTSPRPRPRLPPVTTMVLSLRLIGLLPCLVSAEPRTFGAAEKSHCLPRPSQAWQGASFLGAASPGGNLILRDDPMHPAREPQQFRDAARCGKSHSSVLSKRLSLAPPRDALRVTRPQYARSRAP